MPGRQSLNILDENELSAQAILRNIQKNDVLKNSVSKLQHIFRKHFFFSENEINLYICNICRESDVKAVSELERFFTEFVENDNLNTKLKLGNDNFSTGEDLQFLKAKRHNMAKSMVHDTLDLYFAESNMLSQEFSDVLKEAKRLNIDPYRFAIKSNLKNATAERFENCLSALIEHKYTDKNTNEQHELFRSEELKDIFDQCASIACRINKENIENLLDVLNDFFYDAEIKAYVYDVRDIIKSVPSILLTSPAKMETTIEMLELSLSCENASCKTKKDLLDRIKASPSILTVDFEKVMDFEHNLSKNIEKLILAKPFTQRTKEEKNTTSYAEKIAETFAFDINHLTQIGKMKTKDFEKTASVLQKFLGEDNAITCLQNMTILTTPPEFLEYYLAVMTKEEELSKVNLRQYFVESPYSALTKIEFGEMNGLFGRTEKNTEHDFKREKKEITVKNMPKVSISNVELEKLQKGINNKNKNLVQELLIKMKDAETERLKKEAQERKERILKEKNEKKEKKALLKQQEKEKYKLRHISQAQTDNTITVTLEMPKTETVEEAQARHRNKIPAIDPAILDDVTVRDYFRVIYEPIINAFQANGYYPKDIPNFNKVCSAYEKMIDALNNSLDTREHIKSLVNVLKNVTKPILKMNSNTLSNLKEQCSYDYTMTNLQYIINTARLAFNQTEANERTFNNAVKLLNKTDKYANAKTGESNKRAFFTNPVNEDVNFLARNEQMNNNFKEYITALEQKAEAFFGESYADIFYPDFLQDQKKYLDNFFMTVCTPNAFNSYELEAYGQEYMCKVALDLMKKGIIKDNMKAYKLQKAAEGKLLKSEISEPPIAHFTIYESECAKYGFEREEIIDFIELTFKINDALINKLTEISYFVKDNVRKDKETGSTETLNTIKLFYKENPPTYIDVPLESKDSLGMPPSYIFPDLNDYKSEQKNDILNDTTGYSVEAI